MPRSIRVEYEGAMYHVLCRGNRREAIFREDTDRELFLETLQQMCQRTGMLVHSYVLMSNHYHLLLETPQANLSAGMKWFQGTYARRSRRWRATDSDPRSDPRSDPSRGCHAGMVPKGGEWTRRADAGFQADRRIAARSPFRP